MEQIGCTQYKTYESASASAAQVLAALMIALPNEGGTAFPNACIAARDEVGNIHSAGNPIMIAVSCTFKQRIV